MKAMQRFVLSLVVGMSALLAACHQAPPPFENVDVTGANYGHDFSLTDENGVHRTLADFRGKVVVVFFGYTQCPDVCPTTLTDLSAVMKQLGPDSDRVQVLFVTLDPDRDTPQVLSNYMPSFDKRFLGLYGTQEQTDTVVREFKVYYKKVPGATPTSYSIDHTAGSFVFDTNGQLRLFVRMRQDKESLDPVVHDLRLLLHP